MRQCQVGSPRCIKQSIWPRLIEMNTRATPVSCSTNSHQVGMMNKLQMTTRLGRLPIRLYMGQNSWLLFPEHLTLNREIPLIPFCRAGAIHRQFNFRMSSGVRRVREPKRREKFLLMILEREASACHLTGFNLFQR